jgi:hypothetical protein
MMRPGIDAVTAFLAFLALAVLFGALAGVVVALST